VTIVDTKKGGALYVWEHQWFPAYYIPWSGLPELSDDKHYPQWEERGVLSSESNNEEVLGRLWRVHVDNEPTHAIDNVYETIGTTPQIGNMLRIPFASAQTWLEEDTPMSGHPKDPYHRVDTLTSLRPVKVSLNGKVLAESPYSVHLYETKLPCRFYIPLSTIDQTILRKNSKTTQCPYKGTAEYYDVILGDEVHEGLVWYYNQPNMECAQIIGLCCFYGEKVDLEVDGEKIERPKTPFS